MSLTASFPSSLQQHACNVVALYAALELAFVLRLGGCPSNPNKQALNILLEHVGAYPVLTQLLVVHTSL
jgi:hypothetical protein